jgi:hypothetical protein
MKETKDGRKVEMKGREEGRDEGNEGRKKMKEDNGR